MRFLDAALFGLRTAAAAMLALFVAFSLQLDQPGWAATSAVIVAQPILGATLRKGTFRLIGTFIGASAAVVLFALFPQDRIGFFVGLALWGGLCSAAATLLGELVSYAPLLAGYTCAIVAMSAVTDPPSVFLVATARGACIALGIVSTTLVFSLTDLGRARARLASAIETEASNAMSGLGSALLAPAVDLDAGQAARRALIGRVATLGAVIDQALGENVDLRARVAVLRRAIAGIFVMLSSWRGVEQHRRQTGAHADAVALRLEDELAASDPSPHGLRAAAERMERDETENPSQRLLLDRAAHGLNGLAAARAGVLLLRDPLHAGTEAGLPATHLRDPLAALLNGLRSAITVGLAAGIWVVTGWDEGPTFVIFAMVVVVLFSTREEAAFAAATAMATSAAFALILAGTIRFAAFPFAQGQGFDDFGTLCVILGGAVAVLGTTAALLPPGRPPSLLMFMTFANLMPLLGPTNEITYDFAGFLGGALAIVGGATFGASAHALLPPLPRWLRTALALRAARRDLRRIASGAWQPEREAWEARLYARLVGLPPGTPMLDLARLLAALSVGRELLRRSHGADDDPARRAASEMEVAEAVRSHPDFFADLGLSVQQGH
jgi:uncharacterized membrane protein YccC